MAYSNTWKRAHATSITITPQGDGAPDAQTFADATVIGISGDMREVIEKTSLGASRKEYDPADVIDSPEITITVPYTGAEQLAGQSNAKVDIDFATGGPDDLSLKAHIVGDKPGDATVGGLLSREITIKPLGDWS